MEFDLLLENNKEILKMMKAFSNVMIVSFINHYLARCSKTYFEPLLKTLKILYMKQNIYKFESLYIYFTFFNVYFVFYYIKIAIYS